MTFTRPLPRRPRMTTSRSTRTAIAIELAGPLSRIAPVSDNDEDMAKHPGYALLAVLWGRSPFADILDYHDPGMPTGVLYGSPDQQEEFRTHQEQVLNEVWAAVAATVSRRGRRAVSETLVELANEDELDHPLWFGAWYFSCRFDDAVGSYGPHPDGFVVLDLASLDPLAARSSEFVLSPTWHRFARAVTKLQEERTAEVRARLAVPPQDQHRKPSSD